MAQPPYGLRAAKSFTVRSLEEVDKPLEPETGAAAPPALDEPIGVEQHPIARLQLDRFHRRRRR